jgi:3-oxoadipate enol-lactonase
VPTLVLSGAADRVAPPAFGVALARRLPHARYVLLEGAAHGLTIHAADAVNDALLDHLDGAEGRRPEVGPGVASRPATDRA